MMRRGFRLLLALMAVVLLGGCGSRPPGEEVWAEVNGQPILRAEVEKYFQRQVSKLPEPLSGEEALGRKLSILKGLIENEILFQKAAQAGLLASTNEVEARWQELRAPFSDEEYQRQLDSEGMTVAELKQEIHREVSIDKLLEQAVTSGIEVSEQEIADYYEQFKEHFSYVEAQYHVALILVTPRGDREIRNLKNDNARTNAQAQRKTQLLVQRLRAGDDFAELARNYSEDPTTALAGGDLGFFPESSLAESHPALRQAVQRLREGQWFGPVFTPEGYHIVKLLEYEPPGQRELSNPRVQRNIRELLQGHKRQVVEAAYNERARNQARVVNYLAAQILEAHQSSP